jgi:hypothetical protein
MSKLSYGWAITIGFIEILVTLAIFSDVYDTFEVRVLAILVIIYTTLRVIGSGIGRSIIGLTQGLEGEFRKLNKAEYDQMNEDDKEWETEQRKETQKMLEKVDRKIIIDQIVVAVMYIIAVFNLFGTL